MAANPTISKEALLRAIGEIPSENLSVEAIADKVARLFTFPNSPAQAQSRPGQSLGEARRLFKKYVLGNTAPRRRKPVDPETYRQNLLNVSVWSDADLQVFEENRQHFNHWTIETW